MSRSSLNFRHACLLVGICVITTSSISLPVEAGVDDYGVMWSNQLKDGENNDGTYNRYNLHGGGLTTTGYANDAWIHSNSATNWMWGKQSTVGGWQVAYTQFDHWGNNVWTDFTGITDQVYGRGFAVDGNTVVGTGLNRVNMETSVAQRNAYVVRYDGAGNLTDPSREYANSFVEADAASGDPWGRAAWINPTNGDLWTTGYTGGDLQRAGSTVISYSGAGDNDPYVIKHAADGSAAFAFSDPLTTGNDIPGGILADAAGNIYVAGGTNGSIGTNVNAGGYDMYIAKYDSAGTRLWAQQMGGPTNEFVYSMKFNPDGNIVITGDMSAAIDGTTNAGGEDAYVRVIDTDGTLVWNDQFGTAGDEGASGLSWDDNGKMWTGGWTGGDLAATSAGNMDVYWRQYDTDGTVLQTIQLGTSGDDQGIGAAVDGNPQRLYIGGGIVNGHWRGWTDPSGTHAMNSAEAMTLKVTVGDFYDSDTAAAGQDGYVDWDDMRYVMANMPANGTGDVTYDFNGDGNSTTDDVTYFMEELFESEFGDFDFDGAIDQDDYDLLDGVLGDTWQPGDAEVPKTHDELIALGWRGFTGPLSADSIGFEEWDYLYDATAAVPEPSTLLLMALGCLGGLAFRRRWQKSHCR